MSVFRKTLGLLSVFALFWLHVLGVVEWDLVTVITMLAFLALAFGDDPKRGSTK